MIPLTFRTGNAPIDGIFATPGIECINILILPHYGGVGNHRCFIVDLSSASLIGMAFPNILWCAARKLHCTTSQIATVYSNKLTRIYATSTTCSIIWTRFYADVIFSQMTTSSYLLWVYWWLSLPSSTTVLVLVLYDIIQYFCTYVHMLAIGFKTPKGFLD